MSISRKIVCLGLASIMVFSLFTACAEKTSNAPKGDSSTTKDSQASDKPTAKKPITLDFMFAGGYPAEGKMDTPILKKIEELTGVKMQFTFADGDQTKVILAGGDTTDCLILTNQTDILPCIEGGLLLPLDDLIKTNGDKVNSIPARLDMAKNILNDGSGITYVLPSHAGSEGRGAQVYHSFFITRWDYYKEMGYPEVKDVDSYLKVLSDMQKLHPKTDEGKPVYGFSLAATEPRSIGIAANYTYGYYHSNTFITTSVKDGSMKYDSLDADSPFWIAAEIYNKANRLGLLDPDSFTQKADDRLAKCTAGQVLAPIWDAHGDDFVTAELKKDPASIKGFEVLPVEGTIYWADTTYPGGWDAGFTGIPKTCKAPERVMDVLNLMSDYDGARLVHCGVEGVDWNIVDGKPTLTDEVKEMYINNTEEYQNRAYKQGPLIVMTGHGRGDICPDGGLVNLFMNSDVYKLTNKPVDNDYVSHYGGETPFDVIAKKIDAGTIGTHKNKNFDLRVVTGLGGAPEDIARIDNKLFDMTLKAIPEIILAKTPADFAAVKAKTIEEQKAAGGDTAREWWQGRHDELTNMFKK